MARVKEAAKYLEEVGYGVETHRPIKFSGGYDSSLEQRSIYHNMAWLTKVMEANKSIINISPVPGKENGPLYDIGLDISKH